MTRFKNCSIFRDICTCIDVNKLSYDFNDGLLWSIDYTGGMDIFVSPNKENKMHFIGDFEEVCLKFRGNEYVDIKASKGDMYMYKTFIIDRCCDGLTTESFKNFIYQEFNITLIGF